MATNNDNTFPPPGWVRAAEAAAILGVAPASLKRLYADGRVRCGRVVAKPAGRGWCKIYPVEEIRRVRAQIDAERGKLPDGLVDRAQACRMFGISLSGWKKWVAAGRVPPGERVRVKGERGRRNVYRSEDLERLRAEFERLGQPYPDPERPGCHRVPVMSFWETVCEAVIDDESLPLVAGKRWNWMERYDGATPAVVLASPEGLGHVPMRRIVLGMAADSPMRITHANGDPLDCRRTNLVVRDPSHSSAAARKATTYGGEPCTSRFKGVSRERARGTWRATIKKDDKVRYLGRFDDEIAAAEAHDDAARELFGEHAYLNFPNGVDAYLEDEQSRAAAA